MKLLVKTVNYFGVLINVTDDTKYLVTSKEGNVYASNQKPMFYDDIGWCYDWEQWSNLVAEVDLEGMDWKDTLMEVG